jgi:uncharacterized RDD family membrane protein YckC
VQAPVEVFAGLSVQLQRAPLSKRYLALAADLGLISIVTPVVFFALSLLGAFAYGALASLGVGRNVLDVLGIAALVLIVLFSFGSMHAYYIWQEFKQGTTPGKKIFGLRVVSLRGPRLTLGQCALRETLRLVDLGLLFPGLIATLASRKGQRLGDMAAGTMVVWSPEKEREGGHLYLRSDAYAAMLERHPPAVLPRRELQQQCLTFAYSAFVIGRGATTEALQLWDRIVLEHVPAAQNVDPRSRLLFFAELCFQCANGRAPVASA